MKRYITLLLLTAFLVVSAPPLRAEQIPTRSYLSKTDATVSAVQLADYQNGTLEQVHIWNCDPTNAVLNVKHVYTLGTTIVTNSLTTITASGVLGNGSANYTNVYLLPADYLLFYFSSSSTGIVDYVRRVGN